MKKNSTNFKKQSTTVTFYEWKGEYLFINILGKPNSKKDCILGVIGNELKVGISATPAKGKATNHLIKYLSEIFDVPISSVELIFGATSPHKRFKIKSPKKLPLIFIKSNHDLS